jgi:hypothetical protein
LRPGWDLTAQEKKIGMKKQPNFFFWGNTEAKFLVPDWGIKSILA